jgi:ribosomal protein L11 methyltransferase
VAEDPRWWEIRIGCVADLKEAALSRLRGLGAGGCIVERTDRREGKRSEETHPPVLRTLADGLSRLEGELLLRAFVSLEGASRRDLAALALGLERDADMLRVSTPSIEFERVRTCAWERRWQPVEVGDRLRVQPAALPVPEGGNRITVRLLPRWGFGTAFTTTRQCLESLVDRARTFGEAGPRVLDVGCGTGVLGIAAVQLGAARGWAVDTDAVAVDTARANRDLNGIDPARMRIERGSLERLTEFADCEPDGIFVNIGAPTLLEMTPRLTDLAAPGAWAVLAGVREPLVQPVADALRASGWCPGPWREDNGWYAVDAVRSVRRS